MAADQVRDFLEFRLIEGTDGKIDRLELRGADGPGDPGTRLFNPGLVPGNGEIVTRSGPGRLRGGVAADLVAGLPFVIFRIAPYFYDSASQGQERDLYAGGLEIHFTGSTGIGSENTL